MALIIGAAVGGGIVLLLCIVLFVCLVKRSKNDSAVSQEPNDGNEMQAAAPNSSNYGAAPHRRASADYDSPPLNDGEYAQLRLKHAHADARYVAFDADTDGDGSDARYVAFNTGALEDASGAREFN